MRLFVSDYHVLFTMSHPGSADSEADESGPYANTRHVHCAILDRVLPGAEALHHLQSSVPGGRVSDLQQRAGQLHLLEQLRRSPVREWLRPRPSYNDEGDEDVGGVTRREKRRQLGNNNIYLLFRTRVPKSANLIEKKSKA